MDALLARIRSDRYYLVRHHIDSFDAFLAKGLPNIVSSKKMVIVKARCTLEVSIGGEDGAGVRVRRHGWLPNQARLMNYSYTCEVRADVSIRSKDLATGEEHVETVPDVLVGVLPVMLHSSMCPLRDRTSDELYDMGECPFDAGGYFIVDGKEKVLVTQERNVTNRLFVEKTRDDSKFSHTAFVRSTTPDNMMLPKSLYFRVVSKKAHLSKSVKVQERLADRTNAIVVAVPRIKDVDVPLFLLFRALGVESDADILNHICSEGETSMRDFLRASVVDGNALYSQQAALQYLSAFVQYRTVEKLLTVLYDELLPNVSPQTFASKAKTLGYMVRRLVRTCLGQIGETDRDNYMNKRLSVSGELLANEFKVLYSEFWNTVRSKIDNEYIVTFQNTYSFPFKLVNNINMFKIFQHALVTEGITRAFKGTFSAKDLNPVQDLNRISYMSFLSHLRRVSTSLDAKAKIVGPHLLSGSHWGIVCPSESPDGANIGLLKNLSIAARVTVDGMSARLIETLLAETLGDAFVPLSELSVHAVSNNATTKLFVNDTWIGVFAAAADDDGGSTRCHEAIKAMRDRGELDASVSIAWNPYENEVSILADDGRCCRPLYCVVKDAANVSKVDDGKLVYMDVEETNSSALIAMSADDVVPGSRHTHCEVHPASILSVYTSTIPFCNHNQAPRNVFSGAQGKQAVGVYSTAFNNRIDTMAYLLHYPQRPIVSTRVGDLVTHGCMNNGENLIVAIACYTGYNMEDSIILNKSSVERGMFNLTCLKNHFAKEETAEGDASDVSTKVIANPRIVSFADSDLELRRGAVYDKLDEDGMPRLNAYMSVGDAVVGLSSFETTTTSAAAAGPLSASQKKNELVTSLDQKFTTKVRDMSKLTDQNTTGYVDKVYSHSDKSNRFCKVRLRKFRAPEPGDKLASRHGQKGVVGSVMPAEMMPFTTGGLTPDLIVNPHAFPSRMTLGQLLESISAKACMAHGREGYDATPFEVHDFGSVGDALVERGFERHGNEVFHNGVTGEQMQCDVFVGPTFYFRLKHMVADKVNHRADGRVVGLTGQPTKGRSNEGGMRLGEMERDVLLSHGIAAFQKESFMERSDKKTVFVNAGGEQTFANVAKGLVGAERDGAVRGVSCPTAFKLLTQEVQCFGIDMKVSF